MRIYSDRFHVGSGTHVGPITVFPVWSETRTDSEYVASLSEGFAISELQEPEVGSLNLNNPSRLDVLVPEGTVLFGGLQTRVLAEDVLLYAGSHSDVDVRCVEQGRWGSRVDARAAGRAPVPVVGAMRGIGLGDGSSQRSRQASQGDVWARVNQYENVYGGRQTSSLESIMNLRETDRMRSSSRAEELRIRNTYAKVEEVSNQLLDMARRTLPGQNGVMIGVSGQPMFLEIFNDEVAFRAQISEIFRAITLEVPRATGEPTPSRRAVRFAANTMDSPLDFDASDPTKIGTTNNRVDVRSLMALSGQHRTLHTSVISARHELVLAA